ncbi:MAG: hypothetical protein AAF321_10145, partial [Pseudomonadota bacterium]
MLQGTPRRQKTRRRAAFDNQKPSVVAPGAARNDKETTLMKTLLTTTGLAAIMALGATAANAEIVIAT